MGNSKSKLVVPAILANRLPRSIRRRYQKQKTAAPQNGVLPTKDIPDDLTPFLVFETQKPTTRGRFSNVWEGILQLPGEAPLRVAVKVLHPTDIKTPPTSPETYMRLDKRLQREMRIWRPLWPHCPHIAPCLGYATVDGQPALVSPWYSNGNAREYVLRNPTADRKVVISQVAKGLAYLHGLPKPIVHYDVKSVNIMIDDYGNAKITDFGISKILEDSRTGYTTSSQGLGTVRFSSPENDAAETERTCKSDVYSFAGFVLEMLTGKAPFHYVKVTSQVIMVKAKSTIPPHDKYPEIPPEDPIWKLLDRCWARNPDHRPTMDYVVNELARLGYSSSD